MATPHAESAEGQRTGGEGTRHREEDGPDTEVIDLAALETGRNRTSAPLDRLGPAGAEAQAELALLRAEGGSPPARDRPSAARPETDSRREQLRDESRRSADEAERLREMSTSLQREQEATLALVEAVRTELSVLYQAEADAEAQRDKRV